MTKAKRFLSMVVFVLSICFSIGAFSACGNNDGAVKLTKDNYKQYLDLTLTNETYLRSDGDWKIYSATLKVTSTSSKYTFKNCKIIFADNSKCELDETGSATVRGVSAHRYQTSRLSLVRPVSKVSGKVFINE